MTRKTALLTAISILDSVEKEDVLEVKNKLKELADDLPVTKWDSRAILDVIEQYNLDNNKYPSLNDFRMKGLPTKEIIEKNFGQPIKQVMKENFDGMTIRGKAANELKKDKDYWLSVFISYMKENPKTTNITYNKLRPEGTPSWQMIAAMYGLSRWNELLIFCQLPIARKSSKREAE